MASRYNLNFNILNNRYPILKAGSNSKAAKLMGVIRAELNDVISTINDVYDARFIQNTSGDSLDKHGETLELLRGAGEHDDDYRDRLLTDFRDIPEGLSVASMKYAVDQVMGGNCDIDKYFESNWSWPSLEDEPDYSIFGKESIGVSSATVAENQVVACKFNLASDNDVSIRKLTAYLEADGEGKRVAYAAIYRDNLGVPYTKVADADHTVTFGEAAWCKFEFVDVELSQNNDYWLAICVTGGAWKYYYDTGDTDQMVTAADEPPLDDPFVTPTYLDQAMSIYASYHFWEWRRVLHSQTYEYIIALILSTEPNTSELDQIEANIIQVKRADRVVRIVEEMPDGYQLFREIN